jgi:hypothetical protein
MFSVADSADVVEGVKVTVMVQLASAANVLPMAGQLLV